MPLPLPLLPNDRLALAETVLLAAEAAERDRIRALEVLAAALAAGCLYFLLLSPGGQLLGRGDLMVLGSLAVVGLAFFTFFMASAYAQAAIVRVALAEARRQEAERPNEKPGQGSTLPPLEAMAARDG